MGHVFTCSLSEVRWLWETLAVHEKRTVNEGNSPFYTCTVNTRCEAEAQQEVKGEMTSLSTVICRLHAADVSARASVTSTACSWPLHLCVSTGRYSRTMASLTSSNWLILEVRRIIITSPCLRVTKCARLHSFSLSDSRGCGWAGSKVSCLQAPVWTLQGGKHGDRRRADRSDQLGENHRGVRAKKPHFVDLFVLLLFLFRDWYELNASVCILCLSAGRRERGGLPEDGMCQSHSGHQELL